MDVINTIRGETILRVWLWDELGTWAVSHQFYRLKDIAEDRSWH